MYTWDGENRLLSMTVSNGGLGPQYQLDFIYDALAVRHGIYDHPAVSRMQTILNVKARASGNPYDLTAEEAIQRQAMRQGGFTDIEIDEILRLSREQLPSGALQPTRIPGSRRGN